MAGNSNQNLRYGWTLAAGPTLPSMQGQNDLARLRDSHAFMHGTLQAAGGYRNANSVVQQASEDHLVRMQAAASAQVRGGAAQVQTGHAPGSSGHHAAMAQHHATQAAALRTQSAEHRAALEFFRVHGATAPETRAYNASRHDFHYNHAHNMAEVHDRAAQQARDAAQTARRAETRVIPASEHAQRLFREAETHASQARTLRDQSQAHYSSGEARRGGTVATQAGRHELAAQTALAEARNHSSGTVRAQHALLEKRIGRTMFSPGAVGPVALPAPPTRKFGAGAPDRLRSHGAGSPDPVRRPDGHGAGTPDPGRQRHFGAGTPDRPRHHGAGSPDPARRPAGHGAGSPEQGRPRHTIPQGAKGHSGATVHLTAKRGPKGGYYFEHNGYKWYLPKK